MGNNNSELNGAGSSRWSRYSFRIFAHHSWSERKHCRHLFGEDRSRRFSLARTYCSAHGDRIVCRIHSNASVWIASCAFGGLPSLKDGWPKLCEIITAFLEKKTTPLRSSFLLVYYGQCVYIIAAARLPSVSLQYL